jgi:hypothetical protein
MRQVHALAGTVAASKDRAQSPAVRILIIDFLRVQFSARRPLLSRQFTTLLPRGVNAAPDFAALHPGYATEAASWKELLVGFFVALI